MPNLCGVNQRMLAEALQQVRISTTPDKKKNLQPTPSTANVSKKNANVLWKSFSYLYQSDERCC